MSRRRRKPLWLLVALTASCSGRESAEEAPRTPPAAVTEGTESPPAAPDPKGTEVDAEDDDDHRSWEVGLAGFLGQPEGHWRRALSRQPIASVEKGRGGRSLAFKVRLADGTEGYYKPEQSFTGSHFYAELGAYYLDRVLGLGRVPPTVGRRLPWAALQEAAGGDRRIPELTIGEDGTVRGAFIGWIPGDVPRIELGAGWERWIRVGGSLVVTPYVRPRDYRDQVVASREGAPWPGCPETLAHRASDEPDRPERAAELSDLVVFDYLTTNVDRWGGMYTNVRSRGAGGPLIFLDNGAGLSPGRPRIGLMDARLRGIQRFRRRTIDAVRRLDREQLQAAMARDPLAPFLEERQLEGLEIRRRALLEHVADMVREHGDRAMPW